MSLEHTTWIKGLQRQALIDELEAQECDVTRFETEITRLEKLIGEHYEQIDQLRERSINVIGQRNAASAARVALKRELGL